MDDNSIYIVESGNIEEVSINPENNSICLLRKLKVICIYLKKTNPYYSLGIFLAGSHL